MTQPIFWDRDASRYVFERWQSSRPRQRDAAEIHQLLMEHIKCSRPNATVADVGCGPGYWISTILRSKVDTCVGVDISLPRLALFDDDSLQVCASGEMLPFRPNVFDLIVSIHVLEYVNPEDFVSEIWRVLKPGGIFVVCTKNPYGLPWRSARWLAGLAKANPHPAASVQPEIIQSFWHGSTKEFRYFRARFVTDLQDVNDAVQIRLPRWVDSLIDIAASRLPSQLRKYLAWHYSIVLEKEDVDPSARSTDVTA